MQILFEGSKRAWTYFWLLVIGVVSIFPFYWMVSSSMKTSEQLQQLPPRWWPSRFNVSAYHSVFHVVTFGCAIGNSLIVTGFATLGILEVAPGFVDFRSVVFRRVTSHNRHK